MNCVLTGVPTSRNFKGYPVHPDVLTIARYIRDAKRDKHKEKHPYSKERFNLRQILVENKSEIFAELAVRHKGWKKLLFPKTAVDTEELIKKGGYH